MPKAEQGPVLNTTTTTSSRSSGTKRKRRQGRGRRTAVPSILFIIYLLLGERVEDSAGFIGLLFMI
jgi:hypothetical protein